MNKRRKDEGKRSRNVRFKQARREDRKEGRKEGERWKDR